MTQENRELLLKEVYASEEESDKKVKETQKKNT